MKGKRLLLLLMAACLATAARAQAPERTQTAVVMEFEDRTGSGIPSLARTATDAVAVELAASGRYELLKRAEVEKAIRELGLRPPLDAFARRRLAQRLGADVLVEGAVEFVRDEARRRPRTVSVGITVRVLDGDSSDLLAGAAQVGTAARARRSSRPVHSRDGGGLPRGM